MKREDVPIDPKTGLPVLPDGQFFRVDKLTDRHGDLTAYTVMIIKEIRDAPYEAEGWWGRTKTVVPPVKELEGLYQMYIGEYTDDGHYVGMATKLREQDIKRAAIDLVISVEEEERLKAERRSNEKASKSLMGNYPPKRIK